MVKILSIFVAFLENMNFMYVALVNSENQRNFFFKKQVIQVYCYAERDIEKMCT